VSHTTHSSCGFNPISVFPLFYSQLSPLYSLRRSRPGAPYDVLVVWVQIDPRFLYSVGGMRSSRSRESMHRLTLNFPQVPPQLVERVAQQQEAAPSVFNLNTPSESASPAVRAMNINSPRSWFRPRLSRGSVISSKCLSTKVARSESMMDLREGFPSDPISAVDFPLSITAIHQTAPPPQLATSSTSPAGRCGRIRMCIGIEFQPVYLG